MTTNPRNQAARAVSHLAQAVLSRSVAEGTLFELARDLEKLADEVEQAPRRVRDLALLARTMMDGSVPDGGRGAHNADCVACGPANPFSVGLRVFRAGAEVVGQVDLAVAHLDPSGAPSAGLFACLFDDLMGYLFTFRDEVAFTAALTVEVDAAPAPVRGGTVRLRAWVDNVSGSQVRLGGEAEVDGKRLSHAEAIFVRVAAERVFGARGVTFDRGAEG